MEGEIGGYYESDEGDEIIYEDLDVDEAALVHAPDVQLLTGKFIKYDISEPGVLDRHCRRWKRKCKMIPVSDGDSEESYIE